MTRVVVEVNPNAKAVRVVGHPRGRIVYVMDDGTFRIFSTQRSPKDPDESHFATGSAVGKTDEQIFKKAFDLMHEGGVQYYHSDCTPHI